MFWVTIEDFESICFSLAEELLTYNQPFPPYETRFPHILESCLLTPLQETAEGDIYPSFTDKLTILFYLMIMNHPFLNGNKRMAVVTLLVILYGNNKWLSATTHDLYELAVEVANSKSSEKRKQLQTIQKFLTKHVVER